MSLSKKLKKLTDFIKNFVSQRLSIETSKIMSFASYAFVCNSRSVPDPIYFDRYDDKKTVQLVATARERLSLIAFLKEKSNNRELLNSPDGCYATSRQTSKLPEMKTYQISLDDANKLCFNQENDGYTFLCIFTSNNECDDMSKIF